MKETDWETGQVRGRRRKTFWTISSIRAIPGTWFRLTPQGDRSAISSLSPMSTRLIHDSISKLSGDVNVIRERTSRIRLTRFAQVLRDEASSLQNGWLIAAAYYDCGRSSG